MGRAFLVVQGMRERPGPELVSWHAPLEIQHADAQPRLDPIRGLGGGLDCAVEKIGDRCGEGVVVVAGDHVAGARYVGGLGVGN